MTRSDKVDDSTGPRAARGWNDAVFAKRLAGCILVILAAAMLLNFFVNPFSLYFFNWFPTGDINAYRLKGRILAEYTPQPQVLIIGSSRVMTIDPDYVTALTGKPCFNFGLPSAKAEDYYASLRYARETCGAPVNTVIVGFDIDALHPRIPSEMQGLFFKEYSDYYTPRESRFDMFIKRLTLLASMEQTGESLSVLKHALTDRGERVSRKFRPNGEVILVGRDAEIEKGTFNLKRKIAGRIRRYPERSLGMSSYTGLSPERKIYWERFLDYCDANGIKVYVFLTPYHPALYKLMTPLGVESLIGEVREFVSATTIESGGVFRDFSRVEYFGGDPALFYDEIHMQPENSERLVDSLMGK